MLPDDEESLVQDVTERLLRVDPRKLNDRVVVMSGNQAWGAFGEIHKGTYNTNKVCIKTFKRIDDVGKFIERLIREMRVWRKLTHAHIVELLGWMSYLESKEKLCPSLVSHWCDEGDVRTFLRRRRDADRRALIRGIANGLAYLHSQEIIHGDIKPEVTVSNSRESACIVRKMLSTFGTFRYLAPEVIVDEKPTRDEKSDVWAFGCTALEILRDARPYSSITNDFAIIKAIGFGKPPFTLSSTDPTEILLAPCLKPNPNDRTEMQSVLKSLPNHSGNGQFDYCSAAPSSDVHISGPTLQFSASHEEGSLPNPAS
ncbi:kinase-like domain-containing protein [Cantharellus anzutake]|uniref:kinase-like domain-containing protein n=1 Tax=Cantharellus anzutake TaxID=1750568 RepID=UPI00190785CD|nr:kinase-like domain-containing protein [Cantharellus anzutake]KAF8328608.1 kinase-like domain-containing protein [Cantharellus anzutake]